PDSPILAPPRRASRAAAPSLRDGAPPGCTSRARKTAPDADAWSRTGTRRSAARTPVDAERGARRVRPGSVVGLGSRDVGRVGSRTRQERPRLPRADRRFQPGPGSVVPRGSAMSAVSMTETETAGVRGGVAAVVPAWVSGASTPAVGVRVLTQRALRPHQRGLTCGDAVGEAGLRVNLRILTWGDAVGEAGVRVNLRILTWGDAVGEAGVRLNQRILTWGDAYGVPSLRVNLRSLTRSDACGALT